MNLAHACEIVHVSLYSYEYFLIIVQVIVRNCSWCIWQRCNVIDKLKMAADAKE